MNKMTELIGGIQVIKIYAWEKPFEIIVGTLRKFEVSSLKKMSIVRALILSIFMFTDKLSIFTTLTCYVLLGNYITSDRVFSISQYFSKLQVSMAFGFAMAVNLGAEILVTIQRLEQYLLLDEKEAGKQLLDYESSQICISLKNVCASWPLNDWQLKNITLKIPFGSLCIIVGPVGSGKSSILNLVMNELPATSGNIYKTGDISYASQEPWLYSESVQDNILFGKPYVKDVYQDVIKACALEKDLQLLPFGDKTIVGEKGVILSGGQKARINLARCIYRRADIYLLDDPLSAVDTQVGKHLFQNCILSYLKGKTRILVTHQLQHLSKADFIVIMDQVDNINMFIIAFYY